MARPIRIEFPGAFYHVLNRGLERRAIFLADRDYQKFLKRLSEIHNQYKIIIHAYCLMPNHYHLYVETPEANLQKALRYLNSSYTITFNKIRKRQGPLFQGRYKALLVEKDAYSLELSKYIHLNPVKAGLVEKAEDYLYSSFRYYLNEHANKPVFLCTEWTLKQFGSQKRKALKSYSEFVNQNNEHHTWDPLKSSQKGCLLGSETFCSQIKEKYLENRNDSELSRLKEWKKPGDIRKFEKAIQNLTQDQKVQKKMLTYALKKYTPLSLKEIAKKTGADVHYSTVSQIVRRLEVQAKNNEKLNRLLCLLKQKIMSNVKT